MKKDILALGEKPTQGLYDTTITAEAKYSINSTRSKKKNCLIKIIYGNSFHCNERNKETVFIC